MRVSRSEILSRRRLASPLARKRSRSITVVKSVGSSSGRLTPSGRAARTGDGFRKKRDEDRRGGAAAASVATRNVERK